MSKERKAKERPTPTGRGGPAVPEGAPSWWLRFTISLVLAWHLFVVFISPLSVPPASQLVVDIAQSPAVRWYSDSLYLNHGYHFFGPEPPVNQLVRYTVTDASGQAVAEGEFPNTDQQWPRLLYHRHMMLADQSALGPPDMRPDDWRSLSLRAYGRRLLRVHEGERVRVDCVRHNLQYPNQALADEDPNAPDMFATVASVEETAAGLEAPLPVPAPPEPQAPRAEFESLPSGGGL